MHKKKKIGGKEFGDKKTITGIYSQNKSGDFGFVDVEGVEKGYYVFPFNKKDALDGDEVLAEVKVFKGKEEAVIIKVTKRSEKTLVGEFLMGKTGKFGFVSIKDDAFKKDIFIPGKFIREAKDKDIVGVKINAWEGKNPEGEIVGVLGKKGDKGLDVEGFILESGFSGSFPEKVEKELEEISEKIDKKEIGKRKDFRNLFTFTIDGEDAKDLDDAISVKLKENGDYKLYVHIADVANYVREGSDLDKNAFKSATSVYLADRVIPMLPKKLSNNLCSLNPDVDKLTLTSEMIISPSGDLKKTIVYESIIKSDFRLTYKEVDEIINKEINIGDDLFCQKKITTELIDALENANNLKKIISKNKEITGVLNFDFPETKVILDENKEVVEIKEYPKYNSNKLIEEFMIMANYAISRKFACYPFLYRIHEDPKGEDMDKLQRVLDLFGIKYKFKKGSTKEFSEILNLVEKSDKKPMLEKIILRTLSKAIYSPENLGHFGLGINFYSHFTSPIRRYPDLQIHRIIKEKLTGKLDDKRINHYKNALTSIAGRCSDQEKKAESLEYKVRDYFIVQFYKEKVGECFEANITTLMKNGFFVALPDTAEGFCEISSGEYFEDLQEYRDLSTGKKYILGDKVKVKLVEADETKIRLNFALI